MHLARLANNSQAVGFRVMAPVVTMTALNALQMSQQF